MHSQPLIRLSPHRRARLIAWALAMLAWVHDVFFRDRIMSRRRLRQRGHCFSLDHLARVVAQLIILRAAEFARLRRMRKRPSFHRHGANLRPRHLRRSALGARVRRALKHRDVGQRIARLMAVLRALDVWAAHLAKRFARRLTKLWAITARAGEAAALAAAESAPPSADSS